MAASRPGLIVSDSALFLGAEWSYDGLGLPSLDGEGGRESLDGSIGIGTTLNFLNMSESEKSVGQEVPTFPPVTIYMQEKKKGKKQTILPSERRREIERGQRGR